MKNFYAYDNFFQLLVEALIIALAINIASCKTINFFCMWLSQLDWLNLIKKMESLYSLYTVSEICGKLE